MINLLLPKCIATSVIGLLFAASQTGSPAWAQADGTSKDSFSAERPGFTNGTETVAPGRVQAELGYLYTHDSSGWAHRYLDTSQMRLPLSGRSEFRVGLPAYSSIHPNPPGVNVTAPVNGGGSSDPQMGWNDASVSVKWRFLDPAPHRPSLAVIAGTTVPTGRRGFRENNLQPQVDLEASYDFSSLWQLQANGIYTRASNSGQRFNQYAGALNIGYNVSDKTGLFLESYRISPIGSGGPNSTYIDSGVTHLISANMQLDLSAGVGTSPGVKNDFFVAAGIARRW